MVDHKGVAEVRSIASRPEWFDAGVIGSGFHWPTAAVVTTVLVVGWLLVTVHRRQHARGFVSEVDRATYHTLRTAAEAAGDLGDGLTGDGAQRAAGPVRGMLGTPAVAICDLTDALAWDGAGAHHRSAARQHAARAVSAGATVLVEPAQLACADPDCPIRAGLVTPLVVDERVVGTLAAYGPDAGAGLVRATEQVAAYVSSQLEVAEVGRERTRAMEAELRALRAQISPHFIYNSLTAIAAFVRTDPDRARDLLLEFADFSRYSLRDGGAFTTLADELRNVQRYLELEQARFGDRLEVNLLVAPEVLPVALPYLAIQPLVENAVRHGLAAKEGRGVLTITARDAGEDAEIVIEDDGVGADPAVIRRALDGAGGGSVGLGNVDARLCEVYGDEHGLVVETAPGEGTRVVVRVPKFAAHVRPGA